MFASFSTVQSLVTRGLKNPQSYTEQPPRFEVRWRLRAKLSHLCQLRVGVCTDTSSVDLLSSPCPNVCSRTPIDRLPTETMADASGFQCLESFAEIMDVTVMLIHRVPVWRVRSHVDFDQQRWRSLGNLGKLEQSRHTRLKQMERLAKHGGNLWAAPCQVVDFTARIFGSIRNV